MSVDKSIDQEVLIQVEDLRKAFGENEVLTGESSYEGTG